MRFPSQLVVSYELHVLANLKIKLASSPANSKKSDDKKKLFVKKAAASMKQTIEKWMEDTLVHSTKGLTEIFCNLIIMSLVVQGGR